MVSTSLDARAEKADEAAPLQRLVDAVLGGSITTKEYFVSFERTVLIPSPQGLPSTMKLQDGREVQIQRHSNHYYGFTAVAGNYAAAFSSENAMHEPASMLQAQQLYGYDRSVYWYLELTHPFRIMEDKSLDGGAGKLIEQRNILSIFPASEAERKLGAFPADVGLITHLAVAKISYSVLQLGCENFSRSFSMGSNGGTWSLERGGVSSFKIEGDKAKPSVLDYRSSDGVGVKAIMDYGADEMTIEKFTNFRNPPFSKVRYKLLGFSESTLLSKGRAHFWKTHTKMGENILIHTVEKGVRTEVTRVTEDALREVAIVQTPEVPLYSRRLLFFACITLITALFAVIINKQKVNRKKTENKNEKI